MADIYPILGVFAPSKYSKSMRVERKPFRHDGKIIFSIHYNIFYYFIFSAAQCKKFT
jgi:hypothetical protein